MYYRSVRQGRAVRHVYFGSGPKAAAAAAEDDLRRAEQAARRLSRERQHREWGEVRRPLQELAEVTTVLLDATLLAAGYHRHGRGRWRRWRKPMSTTTSNAPPPPAEANAVLKRLLELSDRAQHGDGDAIAELREILDVNEKFWQKYGDLTRSIRLGWAKRATAGDSLRSECMLRRVEEIEKNLSRPDATHLEQLLVKRVGAAYLALQVGEVEAAGAANGDGASAAVNRRDTLARLAAAERMFQSAAKALTLYQTMTRPRPSPSDLLRPVEETAPAGRSAFESRRSMAGVGVG
jgi:hypothetical protein